MSNSSWTTMVIQSARVPLLLGFFSLLLAACGDPPSPLSCGEGTREEDGRCLSSPTDELRCGEGTVLEQGVCVPTSVAQTPTNCGPGTVESGGNCVAEAPETQCGEGTIERDGICLPEEFVPPCGPGTHYVEELSLCIADGSSCHAGELFYQDECVEFEGLQTDLHLIERTNPEHGAEPAALGSIEESEAVTFKGELAKPQDFQDEGFLQQDTAVIAFEAEAGTWLDIALYSGGEVPLGFSIAYQPPQDASQWYTSQSPLHLQMQSKRLFLVPYTGTYYLTIAPQHFFFSYEDTLLPVGGEEFIFVGEISVAQAPDFRDVDLSNDNQVFQGEITDLAGSSFRIRGFEAQEVLTILSQENAALAYFTFLTWREDELPTVHLSPFAPGVGEGMAQRPLGEQGDDVPFYIHFDWFGPTYSARALGQVYQLEFLSDGFGFQESFEPDQHHSLHFEGPPNTLWTLRAIDLYTGLDSTNSFNFKVTDDEAKVLSEHEPYYASYPIFYDILGGRRILQAHAQSIYSDLDEYAIIIQELPKEDLGTLDSQPQDLTVDSSAYFVFQVEEMGELKLTAEESAGATLYSISGELMQETIDLTTSVLKQVLGPGHYLLHLSTWQPPITAELRWQTYGDDYHVQASGNDSFDNAAHLPDWNKTIIGMIDPDQSEYIWKVEISEPQAWKIQGEGPFTYLEILNADELPINSASSYVWQDDIALATVVDSGEYYIRARLNTNNLPSLPTYQIRFEDIANGRTLLPVYGPPHIEVLSELPIAQWTVSEAPLNVIGSFEPGINNVSLTFEVTTPGEYTITVSDLLKEDSSSNTSTLITSGGNMLYDPHNYPTVLSAGLQSVLIASFPSSTPGEAFSLKITGPHP